MKPAELDSHRSGLRLGVSDPEDHGRITCRLDPHQSGITPDVYGGTRDQAMLIVLEVGTRRIDVAVIRPVSLQVWAEVRWVPLINWAEVQL